MKTTMQIILGVSACFIAIAVMAGDASAGASKKDSEKASAESVEQQPGQPLYFDPEKSRGAGIDDSAPYSDPYYGKDREAGGGGTHRGPTGVTEDPSEVKRIEGPVRYERVEE